MEIFHCFPLDIFLVIFSYLDYGDPLDGALFSLQLCSKLCSKPWLKYHWLKIHNFQVRERKLAECEYQITTTIDNINGMPVLHSIDDQPAFIISHVPLGELRKLPVNEKSEKSEGNPEDIRDCAGMPHADYGFAVDFQDWNSFGYLHRYTAGGSRPTRQIWKDDSGFFFQFYFVNGYPRHFNDGPAVEYSGSSCGGDFYTRQWISGATKKMGNRKNFVQE